MACREILCGQTSPEYMHHTFLRVFYRNMYHRNKVKVKKTKQKMKEEEAGAVLGAAWTETSEIQPFSES